MMLLKRSSGPIFFFMMTESRILTSSFDIFIRKLGSNPSGVRSTLSPRSGIPGGLGWINSSSDFGITERG
jgi:hypothetical protein